MSRVLIITLCTFVLVIVSDGQGTQCPQSTSKNFASKTAYRNAGTPRLSQPKDVSGCTPLQVYGIFRHGTRFPSVTDVYDMISKVPGLRDMIVAAYEAGNGSLCQQDKILIKSWKMNFNGSMTNMLHAEGQQEANAIARRLKNRFPNLFAKSYSSNVYQFRSTDSQRTIATASAFVHGLFETDNGVKISTKENESLLRFYKSCKRWESEVDDNETAINEYFRFIHSHEIVDIGDRVSKRIGLEKPLNFKNVSILWEMCRFETAWNRYPDGVSPWCNLFSDEDLNLLEYSEDVLYYWKEGFGYPINYEQACPILADIFNNFNSFKDPSKVSQPSALMHFSHSGLLLKLYARLGLFNDSRPLLADDYLINSGRKWKTSTIDPFGANIVFVLFNCTDTSPRGQLKVMAFVQEQEVFLNNCSSTLCPLDTLISTYGSYSDHCHLDELCKPNNSAINSASMYLITLTLILLVIKITK